ncbi:DUF3892 domain-containing protein [Halodesulfurarchaeum sp. HSR-GB]|uniref:DUF3892 domain-containing protein n=1 Tax=Halodesulfurarchaeum sp. HSR-GB TaxID=3074077 RepID=UPI0028621365|nr:DUF3892 domain-containing protein [Halodesulfurarchaeum sp. HSR-GB]MDR5657701.1 DUF3892 domain-containing protein [Halodesulfurarchaeum sp. HSR-GB]
MTSYRIVCTEQDPPSEPHDQAHIVAVGTGNDPDKASRRWELNEVLVAMDGNDEFYTKSESTSQTAEVHKYECGTCGQTTLRSTADETEDNNLNNLRECRGWG